MLEPFLIASVTQLASEVLSKSFRKLGAKYSVDVKYVLNDKVGEEFQRCITVAIEAFFTLVSEKTNLEKPEEEAIAEYMRSPVVIEEIWHLLDPGSEVFDRGLLVKHAVESLPQIFGKSTEETITRAWEEFLKAFSFASRSAPELREFLRASYEAGSFRALSNIEDVLKKMDSTIDSFRDEELVASKAIEDYTQELKSYKTWAMSFLVG